MANQIIYRSSLAPTLSPSIAMTILAMTTCCFLLATIPSAALAATDNSFDRSSSSGGGGGDKVSQSTSNEVTVAALQEQVKLLSKQLTALTMRRREDYQLLENNMKKYIVESAREFSDIDIQTELRNLKEEVRHLREPMTHNGGKERLTVQWLSQSIGELRKELAEVQQISSESSRESVQRSLAHEELQEMKAELQTLKLEVESLRSRQETTEVQIVDMQTEAQQSVEDLRKSMLQAHSNDGTGGNQNPVPATIDFIEPEADHRLRHQKALRQQMHKLERAQHQLRHELRQLKAHHIEDRLTGLETEQRQLATSNFNLSREVTSLDKMHSSMLELLEDVEGIQTKFDKVMPDVRREISKLEFNFAQLNSEQGLVREEGRNRGKSIQAIAVSVSTLQADREVIKKLEDRLSTYELDLRRVEQQQQKHMAADRERDIRNPIEKTQQQPQETSLLASSSTSSGATNLSGDERRASELVQKLERIESEYENIVNKLPNDCSQVHTKAATAAAKAESDMPANGYYLIAPQGQQHPIMARCQEEWTVVQRRYDGTVDFNRSWDEYSYGFGSPTSEFWIGNDKLFHLTQDNCTKLRIEMQDIYDNFWYAEYGYFKVESRDSGYRLIISEYQGNASDALDYQNHMEFSAVDIDRDISNTNCAGNYEGGWWFSHCQHANLNGRYNLGLTWFDSTRNEWIAVKTSTMLVGKDQVCLSMDKDNYSSLPVTERVAISTETSV